MMGRKLSQEEIRLASEEIVNLRKLVYGHVETTNRELGVVQTDIAVVRTDVSWLKKYFWTVITANVVGAGGILYLVIKTSL